MKSLKKFKKQEIQNTIAIKGGNKGLTELAETLVDMTVKDVNEFAG